MPSVNLLLGWVLPIARFGRSWYIPNVHPAWPLRTAELLALDDGLVAAAALADLARRRPDHVAFSDGVPAEFAVLCDDEDGLLSTCTAPPTSEMPSAC